MNPAWRKRNIYLSVDDDWLSEFTKLLLLISLEKWRGKTTQRTSIDIKMKNHKKNSRIRRLKNNRLIIREDFGTTF